MANPTIEWNSASREYGTVNFQQDSDLVVIFYQKSVRDPIASRDRAIPIFKDVIYVKIFRPGEQLNTIDRPAEETDRRRFANQWNKFQHNQTQVPEGTPIDLLFPNNPSVADSLRAHGIHTVQQCANLTSHAIDHIGMGGQEYVNRAKQYIAAASSGSSFIKYQEENKKKDQEIKLLNQQVADLKAQLDGIIRKMADPTAKNINPATGMPNPGFIDGYDPQTERINHTHVTSELKPGKK